MTLAGVSLKNICPFCVSYESVFGTWPLKTMRYLPKGRCWHIMSGEAMGISPYGLRLAASATRGDNDRRIITLQSRHQMSHPPVLKTFFYPSSKLTPYPSLSAVYKRIIYSAMFIHFFFPPETRTLPHSDRHPPPPQMPSFFAARGKMWGNFRFLIGLDVNEGHCC